MKIINILGLGLSVIALGLSSCSPMNDCKNCEVVTYKISTGAEIDRQSAIEYCGPALEDKENTAPVESGDERIVWECN